MEKMWPWKEEERGMTIEQMKEELEKNATFVHGALVNQSLDKVATGLAAMIAVITRYLTEQEARQVAMRQANEEAVNRILNQLLDAVVLTNHPTFIIDAKPVESEACPSSPSDKSSESPAVTKDGSQAG